MMLSHVILSNILVAAVSSGVFAAPARRQDGSAPIANAQEGSCQVIPGYEPWAVYCTENVNNYSKCLEFAAFCSWQGGSGPTPPAPDTTGHCQVKPGSEPWGAYCTDNVNDYNKCVEFSAFCSWEGGDAPTPTPTPTPEPTTTTSSSYVPDPTTTTTTLPPPEPTTTTSTEPTSTSTSTPGPSPTGVCPNPPQVATGNSVLIGYWHNWADGAPYNGKGYTEGSPYMRLQEWPLNYNVLQVSFATGNPDGSVVFAPKSMQSLQ